MTTLEPILAKLPPLRTDDGGAVRVGASRVTLDTVIVAYEAGASPEEIRLRFPSLVLSDIYAVVSYHLNHQSEVKAYLEERSAEAEAIQRKVEALYPPDDFRARLLARREDKK